MQLDYSDALIGGGFSFKNPNATQTCGCGKSFAAEMWKDMHILDSSIIKSILEKKIWFVLKSIGRISS